jgi:hypothetical protein
LIIIGSPTVLIGGQPAARQNELTAHGGTIVTGFPTVLIGPSSKAGTQAGQSKVARSPEGLRVPGNG